MAAQNRQAVNWLGNAWAQVVLSRAAQAAPGIPIPPTVTPALIDFWTAMADPVVECVESHIFDDESGIGGGGNNRVPEAPVDGHVYGRGNKAWTLIPDLTAPPITGGGS